LLPGKNLVSRLRNRLANFVVFRLILSEVNRHGNTIRKQLGLPPMNSHLFDFISRLPRLILHISTPSFEYPRSDMLDTVRFIGPVLKDQEKGFSVPDWWGELENARSVVLVNQGTVSTDPQSLIVPAMEALGGEDLIAIAVPVKAGDVGRVAQNFRTEPYIPFEALLPHVDVMVANGGYGGTQMALAHGIPVIVAGDSEDKMEVGARVEWARVGINLKSGKPTARRIREAVVRVLSEPTYRKNAERVQRDFANHDAPQEAAELLEDLADKGTA
jgi:UDP:flavonoid glycosyltransferase YjiC (YdhE family)